MFEYMFAAGYTAIKGQLLPLAVVALLIDAGIVSIWYIIGTLLNNSGVKASAKSEGSQLLGTAVMIAIILYALATFSMVFYSSLGGTALMSQTELSNMCTSLTSNSPLSILGSGKGSLLTSQSSNTPGICDYINAGSGGTIDSRINYPLAASAVINANLTNQLAMQLNNIFIFGAFVGFYSSFGQTMGFGAIKPGGPGVDISIYPYKGFEMVTSSLQALYSLLSLAIEIMIAKMLWFAVSLFVWPYLLFSGIILRSTLFTRKIGGLLIAIAVGMVFFYPAILSVEYLVLANPASYSSLNPYLPSSSTQNPLSSLLYTEPANVIQSNTISQNYKLNLFILPQVDKIAKAEGCWPVGGSLIAGESEQIGLSLVPTSAIINPIMSLAGGAMPRAISDFGIAACSANGAENTMFDLFEFYGITGITIYWLPLINILITLSGILGLSGLFGGDTSMMGLSKLI